MHFIERLLGVLLIGFFMATVFPLLPYLAPLFSDIVFGAHTWLKILNAFATTFVVVAVPILLLSDESLDEVKDYVFSCRRFFVRR